MKLDPLEACSDRTVQHGRRRSGPGRLSFLILFAFLAVPIAASAALHDVTVTDVTTRAFAVAWFSDEPVLSATIKVYTDESGLDEITGDLDISVVSASHPPAMELGLVKVDVVGLEPDSTYYFSLETTTGSGLFTYPASPPLAAVTTAVEVSLAQPDAPDQPIVNDLILHSIFGPDGTTPSEGTLLVVSLPGISPYPISAFVGEGVDPPMAIADLSNLFDADGVSAQAVAGAPMLIREFRGRVCPPETQQLVRFRRVPAHDETPPITELEDPAPCFASGDFNCSGAVDAADFNEFLIRFGSVNSQAEPNCGFNPDYDLNPDGQVNAGDFNAFIITFCSSE
ncbi:MAG: hypothetical protein JJ992_17825 [Planctomycetes bacterium]|nr:hypothetical protein [Planctomycetota bacterium]